MIRTMELILGLPPLSQYDKADLGAYTHLPAQIDLKLKNGMAAYGADRSAKMDFSDYDLVDDFELNEILWRSIKGKDTPLPPAVAGNHLPVAEVGADRFKSSVRWARRVAKPVDSRSESSRDSGCGVRLCGAWWGAKALPTLRNYLGKLSSCPN